MAYLHNSTLTRSTHKDVQHMRLFEVKVRSKLILAHLRIFGAKVKVLIPRNYLGAKMDS